PSMEATVINLLVIKVNILDEACSEPKSQVHSGEGGSVEESSSYDGV
ncbi:hypothetical protein A2U01_0045631, partial [Trifolium medium]|nr:hypothetical protein [Trifolium medium]